MCKALQTQKDYQRDFAWLVHQDQGIMYPGENTVDQTLTRISSVCNFGTITEQLSKYTKRCRARLGTENTVD
jgi:hypothetical protein